MLKIVTAPNPILSQKAKKVNKVDKATLRLIEDMKKALLSARDPVGVGLAAPQVGRSLQIFIAKPTNSSPIALFINPVVITQKKAELKAQKRRRSSASASAELRDSKKLEGCLSLPDIWGEVKRESNITISYQDEKGKICSQKFNGFMATIIQHENDHLNGILSPKRVLEQKGKLYKSHKDEKGEDVFEEMEI